MKYKISITLNIEASSEADAFNECLDRITDGDYEVNDIEIESD